MRSTSLWSVVAVSVAVACASDPAGGSGTKPDAPASVTATVANGKITVEWPEVANATRYNMYMAAESGVRKANYVSLVGNMFHPGLNGKFDHPDGLTANVTYYFVVTALNSAGESAESCEVTATIATATGGTCS